MMAWISTSSKRTQKLTRSTNAISVLHWGQVAIHGIRRSVVISVRWYFYVETTLFTDRELNLDRFDLGNGGEHCGGTHQITDLGGCDGAIPSISEGSFVNPGSVAPAPAGLPRLRSRPRPSSPALRPAPTPGCRNRADSAKWRAT